MNCSVYNVYSKDPKTHLFNATPYDGDISAFVHWCKDKNYTYEYFDEFQLMDCDVEPLSDGVYRIRKKIMI